MKYLLFLSLLTTLSVLTDLKLNAQGNEYIQFSGVVVSSDSIQPVPFVNIFNRNTYKGTVTDFFGFFSFVAKRGDILVFSAVGYKNILFKIPDTITQTRYSLIQTLSPDTIALAETVIRPWPSVEQFKNAFINIEIPDDAHRIAEKNLARAEMKERMENYKMDGSMNYNYYMSQRNSRLYYAGQLPPNNLLNPFAWAEFIKAWREGKFKRKDNQD